MSALLRGWMPAKPVPRARWTEVFLGCSSAGPSGRRASMIRRWMAGTSLRAELVDFLLREPLGFLQRIAYRRLAGAHRLHHLVHDGEDTLAARDAGDERAALHAVDGQLEEGVVAREVHAARHTHVH